MRWSKINYTSNFGYRNLFTWLKMKIKGPTIAIIAIAAITASFANVAIQSNTVQADSTNGRIVYVTSYDSEGGDNELHIMDADGANDTRLTDTTNDEYGPKLSPDGKKILFTTYNNDTNTEQLYTMNADGSSVAIVPGSIDGDGQADWSPDGTKITFASYRTGSREIYAMGIDGSNVIQLTHNTGGNGSQMPSWSPDGTKIVYARDQNIHIMDADGSNSVQLVNGGREPDWSPDGTKIVFTKSGTGYTINTIHVDGTNEAQLTNTPDFNGEPSWSPDGTKIAYSSSTDQITTMNADGSNKTPLTHEIAGDYSSQPSWGIAPPSSNTDQDTIDPATEAAAPNNGDANNDGIADNTQSNVSSFVSPVTHSYVSVQSSCTSNSNVSAGGESDAFKDAGFDYPAGLVAFTLACGAPGTTATVAVYFYAPPANVVARKYNGATHTYQALSGATLQNLSIGGQSVLRVSYPIVDGGVLDQDATANGSIVDPIGLGQGIAGAPRTGVGGAKYHSY